MAIKSSENCCKPLELFVGNLKIVLLKVLQQQILEAHTDLHVIILLSIVQVEILLNDFQLIHIRGLAADLIELLLISSPRLVISLTQCTCFKYINNSK